jgi:hypothetical protein
MEIDILTLHRKDIKIPNELGNIILGETQAHSSNVSNEYLYFEDYMVSNVQEFDALYIFHL